MMDKKYSFLTKTGYVVSGLLFSINNGCKMTGLLLSLYHVTGWGVISCTREWHSNGAASLTKI